MSVHVYVKHISKERAANLKKNTEKVIENHKPQQLPYIYHHHVQKEGVRRVACPYIYIYIYITPWP